MAVITAISEDDARSLLFAYGLADLRAIHGIPAGSVNSNFALDVGGRRLFLRVYEERDANGAERETAMIARLAEAGVPTPAPLRRIDGARVTSVRGKPAALFPWCDGGMRCQSAVGTEESLRVGEALARLHIAGAGEADPEAGRFRYDDLLVRLDRIATSGDPRFTPIVPSLRHALDHTHRERDPGLPQGLIHGDLFRDNVLWDARGELVALLDFESACAGTYVYDLMVTILSWCVGDDLDAQLARAMREGYERVRRLEEAERRALSIEGCFAALRFTITRITDYALRIEVTGPRVVKDWHRFMMRFEKLRSLGVDGVRRALGA